MLQRFVTWAQWFAIPILPVWLLFGTGRLAGDGWISLLLLFPICPILFVILFASPLLSLRVRKVRTKATFLYALGSVVTWVLVVAAPLFIEQEVDSVVQPPSFVERFGFPRFDGDPIVNGIVLVCFLSIVFTWSALGIARRATAAELTANQPAGIRVD